MRRRTAFIRLLLMPFALIYRLATDIRNMLFDMNILPSESFPVPVICIGNISAGGTGKTPFTEYLIRLLGKQYRVAVLSRGYKRETKGFVLAKENSTAKDIGDESRQIKHKFPDITVAADTNRRRGIRCLLALPANERPNVILLDDAMQHRFVLPSLTIMLTDYNSLYYNDYPLPAGYLRESVRAVYRADIVVVTKCRKDIKPIELRLIEKNMSLMANQHLYFSGITYHEIEPLFPSKNLKSSFLSEINKNENILLITAIANPQPLIDLLKTHFNNIYSCEFPDHHSFNQSDIQYMNDKFRAMTPASRRIICTEKDAARLKSIDFLPVEWESCLYYLPISVTFMFEHEDNFDTKILKHVISTINMQQKNNAKN
ncbi:MAG: tetraacyldisaccharide 4'-kinase [Tannerella sp.]|jgi:tetraacyldisaccharide 4'-kinase|nr:tetraacyldisaccharide 4'-kinase [Tannerella sp.]